ncbi:Mad3/BUB1 homology region 1 [Macleaya cordata]|uniref:Mad3/BUB1 homology region 1 n=1 Tax=Macleaya cordata TaxID=56857 RepID=A0A200PX52_MACCD|nr:Mad3/BUB1 homology region 1 [Macleaya cordata]
MANDLFSSLISDIKNYTGEDPLHPWLRGVRKMRESLPPLLLKEKLPRFLQKCAQTFQSDRRYRNDSRYLRIWIQLLDFVDDPRALLRTMEINRIGMKKALFYEAYALYYEKLKKFEEAEKMYHLGVQNLAQPTEELQKSYEQFLHRMAQRNRRKARREELRAGMTAKNIPSNRKEIEEPKEDICKVENTKVMKESCEDTRWNSTKSYHGIPGNFSGINGDPSGSKEVMGATKSRSSLKKLAINDSSSNKSSRFCNDETVVVKFVDTAIVGKSEAEDACHHGLVDPTINMKEAMNAINSMFREPLDLEPVRRRKVNRSPPKVEQRMSTGFEVFVDECLDDGGSLSDESKENGEVPTISDPLNPVKAETTKKTETRKPLQETFKIFVDEEESSESGEGNDDDDNLANHELEIQNSVEGSVSQLGAFVFPTPRDLSCNDSDDLDAESSRNLKLREDTVVCRFVGSTILDEPEVENACHHGLVDPTINLKEAMDDINSMFGKPLDFVRTTRPKKQAKLPDKKRDCGGFSILPDEDMEVQQNPRASSCLSRKLGSDSDLFEPTVFTKEAMDDINEMFGKPLDF